MRLAAPRAKLRTITSRSLLMSEDKKDTFGLVLVYTTLISTVALWLLALYLGNQLQSG